MVTFFFYLVVHKKSFFFLTYTHPSSFLCLKHLYIPTKMATEKRLDLLLKWFDDNKIEWDKEALEIKETNGSFGVYAKKNMKKDKTGKESLFLLYNTRD
jgi:hypothetical protein